MTNLLAGSQRLVDTCEAYLEEDLLQQLPSTDMIQPRYEYILQVINHNSYHRRQIVTMSLALEIKYHRWTMKFFFGPVSIACSNDSKIYSMQVFDLTFRLPVYCIIKRNESAIACLLKVPGNLSPCLYLHCLLKK